MYDAEFETVLPDSDIKVIVKCWCRAIVGHDIVDLQFQFLDAIDQSVMEIKFDKEFFEEVVLECKEKLQDAFFNKPLTASLH